jgi:hypothetical protein
MDKVGSCGATHSYTGECAREHVVCKREIGWKPFVTADSGQRGIQWAVTLLGTLVLVLIHLEGVVGLHFAV